MEQHVGQTHNGMQVYVHLIGSRAGKRIARQPQLFSLAQEMIGAVTLRNSEASVEYDMKRPIGYCFTVETTGESAVFYGRLLHDEVYTRFVKNGKPLPTSYLSTTFIKKNDTTYELLDVWIGQFEPQRPGSDDETAASREFWSSHAVILDGQILQPRTVTKQCPY